QDAAGLLPASCQQTGAPSMSYRRSRHDYQTAEASSMIGRYMATMSMGSTSTRQAMPIAQATPARRGGFGHASRAATTASGRPYNAGLKRNSSRVARGRVAP